MFTNFFFTDSGDDGEYDDTDDPTDGADPTDPNLAEYDDVDGDELTDTN